MLNTVLSGGTFRARMLALMIGALMLTGGMDTIKQGVLIGSMPCAVIMVLMFVSTLLSVRDHHFSERSAGSSSLPPKG